MNVFAQIFASIMAALASSKDVTAMDAETRSSRAGKAQRCSVCGVEGHKSPRHAPEREQALRATITELEGQVAEANERASITVAENRQLWAEIDKLKDRLALAESIASIATNGEATRI